MKYISIEKNETEPIYIAKVEHMGKIFTGTAKVHPEDAENESSIFGYGIAELRAIVKALKYEHKIAKEKCEECRKFVNACSQYKNFDSKSPTAKTMYRQLNRRIAKVNQLADEITNLELSIKVKIRARDKIVNKYYKDKNN